MIISVDELREYVTTDKTDKELTALLEALEISVRKRTNNNFQKRAFRHSADIIEGVFISDGTILFKQGETVQISRSKFNDGLYTIASVDNKTFTVNESVYDENNILVTKIEYPSDVVMGVVDIIKWKLKNEAENSNDKKSMRIQSETLSRHSVTYAYDETENDIDEEFGVPKKYCAFLKAYKKARF